MASAIYGQSKLADLRWRFAHETDPVHRAKIMPRLGAAEFQEINTDFSAGKLPDALAVLQDYRDEVQTCEKGLDAKGVDAEKHPAGFKQLQMFMRESLRETDELLPELSSDEQTPFLAVRRDLEELNTHLIHELFPSRPLGEGASPKFK